MSNPRQNRQNEPGSEFTRIEILRGSRQRFNGPTMRVVRDERPIVYGGNTSVGIFNDLPFEVLEMILEQFTLQDLLSFSRASRGAHQAVKNILSFTRLRELAGYRLNLLAVYGAMHLHRMRFLFDLMGTDRCEVCGDFGSRMHIQSGTRACRNCLQKFLCFQLVPIGPAAAAFGLSEEAVSQLPCIISSQPYRVLTGLRNRLVQTGPRKLTSILAVKRLAIQTHGENFVQYSRIHLSLRRNDGRRWRHAPLFPVDDRRHILDMPVFNNVHFGATDDTEVDIEWPSAFNPRSRNAILLPPRPLYCTGCRLLHTAQLRPGDNTQLPDILHLHRETRLNLPERRDAFDYLYHMRMREYTEEDFVEHAKECEAAKIVIRNTRSEAEGVNDRITS